MRVKKNSTHYLQVLKNTQNLISSVAHRENLSQTQHNVQRIIALYNL